MRTANRHALTGLNVVDVESTCWETAPPAGEQAEIIEVGICEIDMTTLAVGDPVSFLVRPSVSRISPFCTALTTLTQEMVDASGQTFAEACRALEERFDARARVWASYGEYDRRMFEQQCRRTAVPYPFGPRHLNVKTLAGLALGLGREIGLDAMLDHLGLPLEGTHHRGGDDARNIARILAYLLAPLRREFCQP